MSIETEWPIPQRPMGIVTIYAATARLAGRTALRGLVVSLAMIVPLYLLLGSAMHAFFLDASRLVKEHGSDLSELTPQALGDVTGSFAFAGLAGLLMILASSVAQLAVTVDCWDKALGVDRTTSDWMRRLFGRPMAMMLAQIVVLMLVVTVVIFAYVLLTAVFVGEAGRGGEDLAMFAAMAILIYLGIATIFRLHEIVADDRGPWRSLISSMALTRGRWFRIVATILPLMVVLILASELLSPPIGEVDIDDAGSIANGYRAMAMTFTPMRSLALGIVSALAQFLIVNLVTTSYVDLRARRGDFDYDEAEAIEDLA